jgi:endonuclease YncB( thermonuclease family)
MTRHRFPPNALRLGAVAILLLVPQLGVAADIVGRVVSIADGDTLTVLDAQNQQHRIRIAGIDAPEKAQPFGQKSKASLSMMAFNRDVEIFGNKLDRDGRTIAKVMVADPTCNMPACPKIHDAGLLQIRAGLAWWDRQYAREQTPKDREDYEVAEFQAKIHRLGLWGDKNPVPPWEWRHGGQ